MISTKSKSFHFRIDVRSALRNWRDSDWRNCVRNNDGKIMSPAEVKDGFLEELANGNEYLPLGDCDNFDPKEGCKGHPVAAEGAELPRK